MKKNILLALAVLAMTVGCTTGPLIANRAIINITYNQATTEGTVRNIPAIGDASVEAPKTTSDAFNPYTKVMTEDAGESTSNQSPKDTAPAAPEGTDDTPAELAK